MCIYTHLFIYFLDAYIYIFVYTFLSFPLCFSGGDVRLDISACGCFTGMPTTGLGVYSESAKIIYAVNLECLQLLAILNYAQVSFQTCLTTNSVVRQKMLDHMQNRKRRPKTIAFI